MNNAQQTGNRTTTQFAPGTLVIGRVWLADQQHDPHPAIVVESFDGEIASAATVWFWTLGAPEPGETVQLMHPGELVRIDDTLTTMDAAAFWSITSCVGNGFSFLCSEGRALREAVREAWEARVATLEGAKATQG